MSVEEDLGYQFTDPELLQEALSHPSLSSEIRPAPPDNQRLEYLGDAVLELVVSDLLYRRYPDLQEGPLTKLRATLVAKPALAKVARRLELGQALLLSNGEESSGGRTRSSNLADAVESIFGALFLDAGFQKSKEIILKILEAEIEALNPETAQGNSKGELQEILQKIKTESPAYRIHEVVGPPHERTFTSSVSWNGMELGQGVGRSKKTSETAAAEDALRTRLWEKL